MQFPNGRQIHVRFNKNEKSFENISPFLKEIRKNSGSIFVFSYVGKGNMLVNVLDSDAVEVQYSSIRTVAGAPVLDQGMFPTIKLQNY